MTETEYFQAMDKINFEAAEERSALIDRWRIKGGPRDETERATYKAEYDAIEVRRLQRRAVVVESDR